MRAGPQRQPLDERLAMPLAQAMRSQRSIRRLRADPVDDATLLPLLELATRAPSGGNRQPWEFLVVRDPATKRRLGRLARVAWAVFGRLYRHGGGERGRRMADAVQWQVDHFEQAPVLVVVCARGWIPPWPPVAATTLYGSVFPAVQNLLLAARAAGLGAGLVTLPLWSLTLARRALDLPWRVRPCAVVPLGWPQGRYGPNRRRPVGERVHVDRYGNRPFRDRASTGSRA